MLRNPDETALMQYIEETYLSAPEPSTVESAYQIVPSQSLRQHYLGNTRGFNLLTLDISLGDWGVACWTDEHLSEIIQPTLLRAPEVILEAPWDPAVDLWNIGALLPELTFGQNMFSGESSGSYTTRGHLAEMNALLGPFPKALLSQAKLEGAQDLFDGSGNVRKFRLKKFVSLSARLGELPDDEAPKFEAFIRRLLRLGPGERGVASDALQETWLAHEYTQSIAAEKVN